ITRDMLDEDGASSCGLLEGRKDLPARFAQEIREGRDRRHRAGFRCERRLRLDGELAVVVLLPTLEIGLRPPVADAAHEREPCPTACIGERGPAVGHRLDATENSAPCNWSPS